MLKLGLTRPEIEAMPLDEGDAYLIAYDEILNPKRPTKRKVLRKKPKK